MDGMDKTHLEIQWLARALAREACARELKTKIEALVLLNANLAGMRLDLQEKMCEYRDVLLSLDKKEG